MSVKSMGAESDKSAFKPSCATQSRSLHTCIMWISIVSPFQCRGEDEACVWSVRHWADPCHCRIHAMIVLLTMPASHIMAVDLFAWLCPPSPVTNAMKVGFMPFLFLDPSQCLVQGWANRRPSWYVEGNQYVLTSYPRIRYSQIEDK